MNDLLANFRTFLDVVRNVSKHTRRAYLTDVEEFSAFLTSRENRSAQNKILDVQTETMRGYLAYLYGRKLKKVSINRKISSLRTFYKYLLREGIIKRNPAQSVQTPKMEKYMPT